jgi:nucleotide-binding universal stress UspA family protein
MNDKNPRVIVGVSGPGHNQAALRYAARLVADGAREVTLVHAVDQPLPPLPPSGLLTDGDLHEAGMRIVTAAASELGELTDRAVAVRTEVHAGAADRVLSALARAGDTIVVQRRGLGRLARLVVGSTTIGLASHAPCNVVAVPVGWREPAEDAHITVGVHGDGGPRPVLSAAFAEAERRACPLHVVHSWVLDPVYADLLTTRVDDSWASAALERIRPSVDDQAAAHPEVKTEVEVRQQWPVDALLHRSATSDLLVLGRHESRLPWPHRLGSITRTLLQQSHCPVMVVPLVLPD